MRLPDDPLTTGDDPNCTRRIFLRSAAAAVAGALTFDFSSPDSAGAVGLPLRFEPTSLLGSCTRVDGTSVIPGAIWYEAQRENDGLLFHFQPACSPACAF